MQKISKREVSSQQPEVSKTITAEAVCFSAAGTVAFLYALRFTAPIRFAFGSLRAGSSLRQSGIAQLLHLTPDLRPGLQICSSLRDLDRRFINRLLLAEAGQSAMNRKRRRSACSSAAGKITS